jgi:hypothetical protein
VEGGDGGRGPLDCHHLVRGPLGNHARLQSQISLVSRDRGELAAVRIHHAHGAGKNNFEMIPEQIHPHSIAQVWINFSRK